MTHRTALFRRSARPASDPLLAAPTAPSRSWTATADDGARLAVREWGPPQGQPVVLAHGWTCATRYWYPQFNALAGQYRMIAYDLRGHGASTSGTRAFSADVLGDDLAAVVDGVESAESIVLVGHSMGGMSIMSFAGRHRSALSERISGAMLVSTGADRLVSDAALLPWRVRLPFFDALAAGIIGSSVPVGSSRLNDPAERYVALSRGATAEQVAFCREMLGEVDRHVRGAWGTVLAHLDVRAGLAALRVPTTVVVGTADRLTPPIHAQRLVNVLAAQGVLEESIVIDGVGHMSSIERPHIVNDALVRLRKR